MGKEKNIFQSINRLLVVYSYVDEANNKQFRLALDKMLNESKVTELKIVVILPVNVKKEDLKVHVLIHYLSPSDVNYFGKLKDPYFPNVIAQPFDTLIWFDKVESKILKLFSKLKAPNRVSINFPNDFFTIQLASNGETPAEIVNFAKNTLEKINTYE